MKSLNNMKHEHKFTLLPTKIESRHTAPNNYLSHVFLEVCDCGVYQEVEFINIKDKGDANEN